MKKPKRLKISKESFIVNLWHGRAGRDDDAVPFEPIREITDMAMKMKDAEEAGYFKISSSIRSNRNHHKYIREVQILLSKAARKGLIDRPYTPQIKR